MTSEILRWVGILGFSLLVSASFVCYGLAFQSLGPVPTTSSFAAYSAYAFRTFTHPLFVLGLVLALGGAATRMLLFSHVGIVRTAMVSEFTLVLSVVFAVAIFESSLQTSDFVGMVCIMAGVYLVESGGVPA